MKLVKTYSVVPNGGETSLDTRKIVEYYIDGNEHVLRCGENELRLIRVPKTIDLTLVADDEFLPNPPRMYHRP